MKHLKIFSAIIVGSAMLTSCIGSDEPQNYQELGAKGLFLAVTETDHYTMQLLECGEVDAKIFPGVEAEFTINGFRTSTSDLQKVLTIPNLVYKVDGENIVIKGTDIVPKLNGTSAPDFMINSFDATIYAGKNISMLFVTAIETSDYIIWTPYTQYGLSGETRVVKDGEDPSTSYVNKDSRYIVNIDIKKGNAYIEAKGAKFAKMMPGMDIVIPDLDLTLTREGYELSAENVIPTIGGTPRPDYAISDVYLNFKNEANIATTLRFNVKSETKGDYSVMATLNY